MSPSPAGRPSPEARAEVEAELGRRRRRTRERLLVGLALVMSAAALVFSVLAFVDGRDHASEAALARQDQRIDDVDEYARPLAGEVRLLQARAQQESAP